MNILSEVKTLLASLNIPIETGTFKDKAPNKYIVLVPLSESFPLSADNLPQVDLQELRVTLYSKENYIHTKNQITNLFLNNSFYITDRRYGGYESSSGYYQYTIDVQKNYSMEEIN